MRYDLDSRREPGDPFLGIKKSSALSTTTTNLRALGTPRGGALRLRLLGLGYLSLLRLLFILGLLDAFLDLTKSSFSSSITNFRLFSSLLLDDFQRSTNNWPRVWLLGGAAPLLDSFSMDILKKQKIGKGCKQNLSDRKQYIAWLTAHIYKELSISWQRELHGADITKVPKHTIFLSARKHCKALIWRINMMFAQ